MNGTKRTRYLSSITNQNQGGGNKKAGNVPVMQMTAARNIAFRNHGYPKPLSLMKLPLVSKVSQSRPTQVRPQNWIGMGGNY
jgi:hypothetical protein